MDDLMAKLVENRNYRGCTNGGRGAVPWTAPVW